MTRLTRVADTLAYQDKIIIPVEIVLVDNSIGMRYKKEVETLKTVQRINTDQHVEFTRYKREADALTTRQIECVNLWDGVKGYWKYDFEIPTSCYSKY